LYTTDVLTKATDGAVAWSAMRESFGKTTVRGSAGTEFLMRFPGQWEDGIGGLNQNLNREYKRGEARYRSQDRLGFFASSNFFGYVQQSPVVNFDNSGDIMVDSSCAGRYDQIYAAEAELYDKIYLERKRSCFDFCGPKPEPCAPCKVMQLVILDLPSTKVFCSTWQRPNACADAPVAAPWSDGVTRRADKMTLYPSAFKGNCGRLPGILFHEKLHNIGFAHTTLDGGRPQGPQLGFDNVYAWENACFQSTTSHPFSDLEQPWLP
jgi:RHS repeat-associated protein